MRKGNQNAKMLPNIQVLGLIILCWLYGLCYILLPKFVILITYTNICLRIYLFVHKLLLHHQELSNQTSHTGTTRVLEGSYVFMIL